MNEFITGEEWEACEQYMRENMETVPVSHDKKFFIKFWPKRIVSLMLAPFWKRAWRSKTISSRRLTIRKYFHEMGGVIGESVCKWMGNHELFMMPFKWATKYDDMPVDARYDSEHSMPYVMYHGMRLYMKSSWTTKQAAEYTRAFTREQDELSPHRYQYTDDDICGKVIADIGAAEGFFGLDVVDRAKHVYLFECDPEWVAALRLTFAPYGDKVDIVERFVGHDDNNSSVTLDTFFSDKKIDFIKTDVEGAEIDVLGGGTETLKKLSLLNICVYHYPDHEERIKNILSKYDFTLEMSPGFMVLSFPILSKCEPPYIRHGVLYARRSAAGTEG